MRTTKTNLWKSLFLFAIFISSQNVFSQIVTAEENQSTAGFTIPDTICIGAGMESIKTFFKQMVYLFIIIATTIFGNIDKKGIITLLR